MLPLRPDPADLARTLDRSASRRRARAVAGVAEWITRRIGRDRITHRLEWRLGRLVAAGPPRIEVHEAPLLRPGTTRRRILLVSNDLSRSGAPQIVVELARLLIERGDRVTILSPADGPRRGELVGAGATVIVDPAIRTADALLPRMLAGAFDVALCNTVDTAACAGAIAGGVPTVLYTHEVTLLEERLAASPVLATSLRLVADIWAGSELSAALVRGIRPDVVVVPYGLDPVRDNDGLSPPIGPGEPSIFSVFASFEPRKGQDLLVEAIGLLDPAVRSRIRVAMYGRVLFPDFYATLLERATELPEVSFHPPLDSDGYRVALLAGDAVLVPSRSDTLPLVSLDALGAGRVLLCTRTTGTSAYLDDGTSGFVAETATAAGLATMLEDAIARRAHWPIIAAAGEAVFTRHFSRPAFATLVGERLDTLATAWAAET